MRELLKAHRKACKERIQLMLDSLKALIAGIAASIQCPYICIPFGKAGKIIRTEFNYFVTRLSRFVKGILGRGESVVKDLKQACTSARYR